MDVSRDSCFPTPILVKLSFNTSSTRRSGTVLRVTSELRSTRTRFLRFENMQKSENSIVAMMAFHMSMEGIIY